MPVAIVAGLLSATVLSVLWITGGWLLGFHISLFAVVYGAIVSGCVAHFSKGRGIVYQAVATFWTVLGILAADTIVVCVHWSQLVPEFTPDDAMPSLLELMELQLSEDPVTVAFCMFGVMGGLFLWMPYRSLLDD